MAAGCLSYTVRLGRTGQLETGRQCSAWAGQNAELTVSTTALAGKCSHPHLLVLPDHLHSPSVLQKHTEEKAGGFRKGQLLDPEHSDETNNNKKIMNTHSGWGDIKDEVSLLRPCDTGRGLYKVGVSRRDWKRLLCSHRLP